MHGDLLAKRLEDIGASGGLKRYKHPDPAKAGGGCVVHVGYDSTRTNRHGGHAAQRHVLADGCDLVGQLVSNVTSGVRIVGSGQRVQIARSQRKTGQCRGEFLKFGVAGHKVGLGVQLDNSTFGAVDGECHQTFRGHAAGFLGSSCQALCAKPVNGGFHVAVSLGKCLLAVHHACARFFAKFLHKCSCHAHRLYPVSGG